MSYITNQLSGSITVSGDLVPSSNVANLGSPTHVFINLYVGSNVTVGNWT